MLKRMYWRTDRARTDSMLTTVGRFLRAVRVYDIHWLAVNDGTDTNHYRAVWLPWAWPRSIRMVGRDLNVWIKPGRGTETPVR